MSKQRISASIDDTLKEQLDNKENINKSRLIESLLREYLAHGEGTTVALKLRREELRKEKQNKQLRKQTLDNEIEAIENQIEELTAKIQERRKEGLAGVDELVEKVERGDMQASYIDETNPIVKDKAQQAGVPPREFAKAVQNKI